MPNLYLHVVRFQCMNVEMELQNCKCGCHSLCSCKIANVYINLFNDARLDVMHKGTLERNVHSCIATAIQLNFYTPVFELINT